MQFSRTLVAALCTLLSVQHAAGLAVPTPGYPKPTPAQGPEHHTLQKPGPSQLPGPVPSSCPPEIAGYLHPPPTGSNFEIPGDFPAKYKSHLEDCIHKLHKRGNPDKGSDKDECVNDLPADIRKGKDSKIVHCVCQAAYGQDHPDDNLPKKTDPENKKTDQKNTLPPKKTDQKNTLPPKKTEQKNTLPPKKTDLKNTLPPKKTDPESPLPPKKTDPDYTHPTHPPANSEPPAHDKTNDY